MSGCESEARSTPVICSDVTKSAETKKTKHLVSEVRKKRETRRGLEGSFNVQAPTSTNVDDLPRLYQAVRSPAGSVLEQILPHESPSLIPPS